MHEIDYGLKGYKKKIKSVLYSTIGEKNKKKLEILTFQMILNYINKNFDFLENMVKSCYDVDINNINISLKNRFQQINVKKGFVVEAVARLYFTLDLIDEGSFLRNNLLGFFCLSNSLGYGGIQICDGIQIDAENNTYYMDSRIRMMDSRSSLYNSKLYSSEIKYFYNEDDEENITVIGINSNLRDSKTYDIYLDLDLFDVPPWLILDVII